MRVVKNSLQFQPIRARLEDLVNAVPAGADDRPTFLTKGRSPIITRLLLPASEWNGREKWMTETEPLPGRHHWCVRCGRHRAHVPTRQSIAAVDQDEPGEHDA